MRVLRIDPDQAREDAAEILGQRRFERDPAPRPLRGPLEWLAARLRGLRDFVLDVLRVVPGPTWFMVALLFLLALAGVIVWAVRTQRRGGVSARVTGGRSTVDARLSPAELERQAADAEAAGDLERALRLRFRAGLLRLDQRGAIRYQPSLTTAELRHRIGSTTFDELAARFEEVAYGRDPARPADVEAARREWPRVVEEATRR